MYNIVDKLIYKKDQVIEPFNLAGQNQAYPVTGYPAQFCTMNSVEIDWTGIG